AERAHGRDAFARRHAHEPAGGAKDDRDQVGDPEADAGEAGDRGERVRRDERDAEAEGRGPRRAADHALVAEARDQGVAGDTPAASAAAANPAPVNPPRLHMPCSEDMIGRGPRASIATACAFMDTSSAPLPAPRTKSATTSAGRLGARTGSAAPGRTRARP